MELDAEFFVAAGFVLFVALLGYLGVHHTLTAAIDERAKKSLRSLVKPYVCAAKLKPFWPASRKKRRKPK